jgi:hypothetical protein
MYPEVKEHIIELTRTNISPSSILWALEKKFKATQPQLVPTLGQIYNFTNHARLKILGVPRWTIGKSLFFFYLFRTYLFSLRSFAV